MTYSICCPFVRHTGILVALSAVLFAVACYPENRTSATAAIVQVDETSRSLFQVYFTVPEDPASNSLRGGVDRVLADAIRQARVQVDIAAYQLNLWSIRDALLDVHQRGLTVRMVTESDNLDEPEVQALLAVGVPVLGDRREGLMHNKFVVIDRQDVWTGSMNYTVNGAYKNNNNLVLIHSPRLAENYTVEFEEMFEDDLFGPGSPTNTSFPSLEENGVFVETYFSPEDGTAARLVELIFQAKQSIYFMVYSFTSDELAAALIERIKDGVKVQGVIEQNQYERNTGGKYDVLRMAGLDVRLDGNPRKMHHKVIIIDETIVITGSYNFSKSAETSNDENTIIVHDPDFASFFISEFRAVFARAKP